MTAAARSVFVILFLAACTAGHPIPSPQMQSECAVGKVNEEHRWIEFYAPPDRAQAFTRYGWLDPNQLTPERFTLYVDARYDLDEVAAYIGTCGEQPLTRPAARARGAGGAVAQVAGHRQRRPKIMSLWSSRGVSQQMCALFGA